MYSYLAIEYDRFHYDIIKSSALGDSIFIQFISATAVFATDATVLVIMPKIVGALPEIFGTKEV